MSFLINPYRFGAGSGPGPYAVTRVALRTTTGTQDITIPGFGTPKAARFTVTAALNDGIVRDSVTVSIGATDGTNQYATAAASRHGVTPGVGNAWTRSATDEVIMILSSDGGIPTVEANFGSWVTDGVAINIALNAGSAAYYVTVELFGGANLTAVVGTTALATQNNSVTLTPGFQTDALFFDSPGLPFNDTTTANVAILSMGFASYDGVTIRQCCHLWRSDGGSAGNHGRGAVSDTRIGAFLSSRYAELHSITSTQFQLTSLGASLTGSSVGYLALNFGAAHKAWAGVLNSPTAIGNHDFTGPSFTPVYGHMVPNMISAIAEQTGANAGAQGVSVFTANGEYCTSWNEEAASNPTDTQLVSTAKAIDLYDHAGVAAFDASFVTFLSNGATLNFTDADATVRKWPALFIG